MDLINSDEVDAVDICLPTYLHTRYAVEAMKRGKAVFIEKPVSRDLEEAELLLKTRRRRALTSWSDRLYASGTNMSG